MWFLLLVYNIKYDRPKDKTQDWFIFLFNLSLLVSNSIKACCFPLFLFENLNPSCCLCQPISVPSPILSGSVNYITSHCSLGGCVLPCWGLFQLASQICPNMFFLKKMLLSYLGHMQWLIFSLVRRIQRFTRFILQYIQHNSLIPSFCRHALILS